MNSKSAFGLTNGLVPSIDEFRCETRICLSCRKSSIRSHTLIGNEIIDHSDVVGASPVGDDLTIASCSI